MRRTELVLQPPRAPTVNPPLSMRAFHGAADNASLDRRRFCAPSHLPGEAMTRPFRMTAGRGYGDADHIMYCMV